MQEAEQAIAALDGQDIGGKKLSVRVATCNPETERGESRNLDGPINDNLYVKGIPSSWTAAQIAELFSCCGTVMKLRVLTAPGSNPELNTALVQMGSVQDAVLARARLHGCPVPGMPGQNLVVRFARNQHRPRVTIAAGSGGTDRRQQMIAINGVCSRPSWPTGWVLSGGATAPQCCAAASTWFAPLLSSGVLFANRLDPT